MEEGGGAAATGQVRGRGPRRRTPRGGREGRAPGSRRFRRSAVALLQARPPRTCPPGAACREPSRPCLAGSRALPGRETRSPLPMPCLSPPHPTIPLPIPLQASWSELGPPYLPHPGEHPPTACPWLGSLSPPQSLSLHPQTRGLPHPPTLPQPVSCSRLQEVVELGRKSVGSEIR